MFYYSGYITKGRAFWFSCVAKGRVFYSQVSLKVLFWSHVLLKIVCHDSPCVCHPRPCFMILHIQERPCFAVHMCHYKGGVLLFPCVTKGRVYFFSMCHQRSCAIIPISPNVGLCCPFVTKGRVLWFSMWNQGSWFMIGMCHQNTCFILRMCHQRSCFIILYVLLELMHCIVEAIVITTTSPMHSTESHAQLIRT